MALCGVLERSNVFVSEYYEVHWCSQYGLYHGNDTLEMTLVNVRESGIGDFERAIFIAYVNVFASFRRCFTRFLDCYIDWFRNIFHFEQKLHFIQLQFIFRTRDNWKIPNIFLNCVFLLCLNNNKMRHFLLLLFMISSHWSFKAWLNDRWEAFIFGA